MRNRVFLLSVIIIVLGVGACGGGGGGTSDRSSGTETLTLSHESGRVAETGPVVAGTTIRMGQWVAHFDQPDGQRRWTRTFVQGVAVTDQPWTEWNADGSVRVDWTDR